MDANDKAFFDELKKEFLSEAMFLLEQGDESCLKLEDEGLRQEALDEIFRIFHSIKGGAAAVGFEDMSTFAHKVENCLGVLRQDPDLISSQTTSLLFAASDALKARVASLRQDETSPWDIEQLTALIIAETDQLEKKRAGIAVPTAAHAELVAAARPQKKGAAAENAAGNQKNTVRVNTEHVDSVLNLIGELVVIKSQLFHSGLIERSAANLRLESLISLFDKTIRDLQDRALRMRTTPLKAVFMKVQRQVRELSQKLDKPASVVVSGDGVEIDRDLIELLSDPLVHIIRNAMDHGVEDRAGRQAAGKPEEATVTLAAAQARGRITITISDDGRGIDREKVLARAIERGLVPPGVDPKTLPDKDVFGFLFKAGFSTAEKVTDLSGRGVGLDVVKSNLEKIKGTIEVSSRLGEGTTFHLSIPLSAAIFDGMVVGVGGRLFILPLDKIVEMVQISTIDCYDAGGRTVVDCRGEMLHLVCLQEALGMSGKARQPLTDRDVVIIVHVNVHKFAVRVQNVFGQAQVVVKPLGEQFRHVPDVGGAAILGDGAIALIVDTDGIARRYGAVGSVPAFGGRDAARQVSF